MLELVHVMCFVKHERAPKLGSARLTALQNNGTWQTSSTDESGDELTGIVSVPDSGTIEVITVHDY